MPNGRLLFARVPCQDPAHIVVDPIGITRLRPASLLDGGDGEEQEFLVPRCGGRLGVDLAQIGQIG